MHARSKHFGGLAMRDSLRHWQRGYGASWKGSFQKYCEQTLGHLSHRLINLIQISESGKLDEGEVVRRDRLDRALFQRLPRRVKTGFCRRLAGIMW